MSLSMMRTPDMRLSLDYIENSPRGTRFLLPIPNTKPELEGRGCWLVDFKDDFTFYLKRSKNRSILIDIKREDCRYWLRNPFRQLCRDIAALRASDTNKRHCILAHFELQDNQVYQKSEMIKGKLSRLDMLFVYGIPIR